MSAILVTKPNALNQRDRSLLRKNGVVVVEAENPADVKLIAAEGAEVSGNDMLFAALKALSADSYSNNTNQVFVKALTAGIAANRKEQTA